MRGIDELRTLDDITPIQVQKSRKNCRFLILAGLRTFLSCYSFIFYLYLKGRNFEEISAQKEILRKFHEIFYCEKLTFFLKIAEVFPSLRSKKIFDYITSFKFRLPSIITPFIFAPFAPSIRPFSFRSLWRKLKVDKNWRPTTINPIYSNQKCKIIIFIITTSSQQFDRA